MKLNFCVQCGATENLHHHHVIPKVKGGSDVQDNFITLCEKHHESIHNIQQCDNFFELGRIGRENARRNGVKFGCKPKYEHLYPQIIKMYCEEWKGTQTIANELSTPDKKLSRSGVQHIIVKLGIIGKRKGSKPVNYKKNKKTGQYKLPL